MYYAGQPRPTAGGGFGPIFQQGFYLNYLHGLDFLCRKHVTPETRVLELGCFYGASSALFLEYSKSVTCVDVELFQEMRELIGRTPIKFHKDDSISFLSKVDRGSYDLIYIDTTHDLEQTTREILLSYDKLEVGQFLAGHDYNSTGVSSAILNVFEYPDIEIYLDSSWLIQKTSDLKLK